jgi:hypothetical protein
MTRRLRLAAIAAALLAAAGVVYARHKSSSRRAERAQAALSAAIARGDPILRVPRAPGPIALDGDTDDLGWKLAPGPAKTGLFVTNDGTPAVPHSQARLVWSGEFLYLALYASDEDIQSRVQGPDATFPPDDDAFHVVFVRGDTEYAFDISPQAVVTDARRVGNGPWDVAWNAGAHASRELGGTVNAPGNVDEEWEIEMAIPLASLELAGERGESLGVSFRRCDTPKESARVCAGWGNGEGGRGRGLLVLE